MSKIVAQAVEKLVCQFRGLRARVRDVEAAIPDPASAAKAAAGLIPVPRDGKDGDPGRDGKDGDPGRDGRDGVGVAGKDGTDGDPGRNGKDGRDGKQGLKGTPGRDGKDGDPGRNGKDGLRGVPGRDGKDGTDGASVTGVKVRGNEVFVDIDGKETKAGALKMPAPFSPSGGGGLSGYLAKTEFTSIGGGVGVDTATHSLGAGEAVLDVTRTATGECDILLTTAQAYDWRQVTVVDAGLNADVNRIRISGEGGALINGEPFFDLIANGEALSLYAKDGNWRVH